MENQLIISMLNIEESNVYNNFYDKYRFNNCNNNGIN